MLENHRKASVRKVACAVITVSDTREKETDKSGKRIMDSLTEAGHQTELHQIIPDDGEIIKQTINNVIHNKTIEAVIINGGTGIAKRDVTIESVQPFFEKEIPGFGELFRMLSYEFDIGSASMLSRATCGVANNRIIFSIPGSSGAVKLAMEKLILPELGHTVMEIHKDLTK
ncbi:molybdenum cofactor biosynthesis protein MoaB [Virgibacillus ainsalahensis]